MKKQVEIEYEGITLEVVGYYTEGEEGDREYPGSNPSFEIEEVYIGKVEMSILLSGIQYSDIIYSVLSTLNS